MKKQNLIDNIWFMRVISLVFSVILFVAVRADGSSRAQNQIYTSVETTETIANVPLYLGKHDEGIFITNVPESVTVTLKGSKNIITQITTDNFKVKTEDFLDKEPGNVALRLTATGLPDGVDYQITPSQINVNIARKETVTVPVEYEIATDAVADNFQVNAITLSPAEVTLTGTQDAIGKIDKVFVRITTNQPRSTSFSEKYKLQIIDAAGKLLDINSNQSAINASVEIGPQTKNVELSITPIGERPEQFEYGYALTNITSVTVQAPSNVLATLNSLNVIVDVTNMTESGTITGFVELPEQISHVNVQEIPIQVTLKAKVPVPDSTNPANESSQGETSDSAAPPAESSIQSESSSQ